MTLHNSTPMTCVLWSSNNNIRAYKKQSSSHSKVCPDPILTTEIVPSFVPLTRVAHRNLRCKIYKNITYTCRQKHTLGLFFLSFYTRQHFITATKLFVFLFFSTSSSLQPTQTGTFWAKSEFWAHTYSTILGLLYNTSHGHCQIRSAKL